MSFDWGEYLSLAEELCAMPVSGPPIGPESQQRAAVSRAYYAAFVLARNHLRDADGIRIPQRGNPHQFVAVQYVNDPDPLRSRIGYNLTGLRAARNRCDYDDVVGSLPGLATRSIQRARQIIADLARL
jgi:hypothetical protein